MNIAYLANSFPEAVEPYVWEEICELKAHAQRVLPCSIKRPRSHAFPEAKLQTEYVFPLRLRMCLVSIHICISRFSRIREFLARVIRGPEPFSKRIRALGHTYLGVYLATLLDDKKIKHIHVHHGFFSSWIGMVAAQMLDAGFSMTLHGSDLLVRADYLDIKLRKCKFCVTVSEFNRRHILQKYPGVASAKVIVQRLGINVAQWQTSKVSEHYEQPVILSVGRLHEVKNHEFLILACRALKSSSQPFRCFIAGDGNARAKLEELINTLCLEEQVTLLGHVPRGQLAPIYAKSDLVVLTSHSEGIPITLIEAMAMEKLVLAPRITGIPELVIDGKTGFLYQPDSMEDFLHKLQFLLHSSGSLSMIRQAARRHVETNFNRSTNLSQFARIFVQRASLARKPVFVPLHRGEHEDPVLQQVQLPI